MKPYILFVLLSLGFTMTAFSQGPPDRIDREGKGERVKAMRIAYITSKLELSPEESEKFWPLFNEMEQKQKALRRNFKQNNAKPTNEAEAKEALENHLLMEEELHNLKKEYLKKMGGVISYQKLFRLRLAEKEFKQELLTRSRQRRRAE